MCASTSKDITELFVSTQNYDNAHKILWKFHYLDLVNVPEFNICFHQKKKRMCSKCIYLVQHAIRFVLFNKIFIRKIIFVQKDRSDNEHVQHVIKRSKWSRDIREEVGRFGRDLISYGIGILSSVIDNDCGNMSFKFYIAKKNVKTNEVKDLHYNLLNILESNQIIDSITEVLCHHMWE